MNKAYALAVLTAVLSGCALPATAGKRRVEWPNEASTQLIVPSVEAGAALAAAAAIREMVRTNPFPRLFRGCSSPEQGLDVAVFKDPLSGLYYVSLNQRFDRCGNPRGAPVRVLDGYYEYAVTPQGEVVAEVLPPDEAPVPPPPSPPPPEQTPPPAAPPTPTGTDTPAPAPAPAPPPAPAAPPPDAPCPASPPPAPSAQGTPGPASSSPAVPSTAVKRAGEALADDEDGAQSAFCMETPSRRSRARLEHPHPVMETP